MHCSLRAANEHYNLEYGLNSQLVLKVENGSKYIVYTERMSKNKQFGLKNAHIEPKITCIYPNKVFPNRCVVRLYEKFISHRPENHGKTGNND